MPPRRRERHVINLGIAAPGTATRDGHLEFARQIVEFAIAAERAVDRQREWRSVKVFLSGQSRDGAAGDVADHVAACSGSRQSRLLQLINQIRNRLNRQPVQLHVLPHSDIRNAAAIVFCQASQYANLIATQNAVWNTNAHHKKLGGFSLSIFSAHYTHTVALRVNTPRTEIRTQPFLRNRRVSITSKRANFVQVVPGELFALQALNALCLGFFYLSHLPFPFELRSCKYKP